MSTNLIIVSILFSVFIIVSILVLLRKKKLILSIHLYG